MFGWPILFIAYVAHSYLYRTAYTSEKYIVVKFLLFLIYNLIVAFFAFETLFPTYDWWQTLARLAEKIPYDRPTEADVLAADVKPTKSIADEAFDTNLVDPDLNNPLPVNPNESTAQFLIAL